MYHLNILEVIYLSVIAVLTGSYVYFWLVTLWAKAHSHIDRSQVTNLEIRDLLSHAKRSKKPYLFTIQITTKGNSVFVVQRGIEYVLKAVEKYPVLKDIVTVEVITESHEDQRHLYKIFGDKDINVSIFVLPKDYETPNGTQLKARALHYMVEQHRKTPKDAYVVHYDEESVLTEDNLSRLVRNLLRKPMGISEGSISYPLEWSDSHPMCRTMESSRPFGCHECYLMMTNPAPLHLHGSNLVVQEKLENQVGWDIGKLGKHPLIAEDLVFGLAFFLKFGKKAFGWHGVEMIEQPPFTTKAAYKQRERWVMGALQGVAHVRNLDGYEELSLYDRIRIQLVIRARVLTYALGMPVSLVSLVVLGFLTVYNVTAYLIGAPSIGAITFAAIPGLVLWLGSNQLGLYQNLRYTEMTWNQKLVEHLRVFILTPFSGLYDTAGPFVALAKWISGKRGVAWKVTPKVATILTDETRTLEAGSRV